MDEIKVLILDDDKLSNKSFIDAAILVETHDLIIDAKESLSDAIEVLGSDDSYDFAIVDISLNGNSSEEGNEFLRLLKNKYNIIPIAYTGQPGKVDQISKLMEVYVRAGEGVTKEKILNRICSIYETGITKILGERGSLVNHIVSFFWGTMESIYESTEDLVSSNISEDMLKRLYVNHLREKMIVQEFKFHPDEIYIIPQYEDGLCNGSIIEYNGTEFIVITPRCTLYKSDYLNCIAIKSLDVIKEVVKTPKAAKKERAYLDFVNGNSHFNYHYLPKSTNYSGGVIDFNLVMTESKDRLLSEAKVIGKISDDFMRNIISKYSGFYARQGQPVIYEDYKYLLCDE